MRCGRALLGIRDSGLRHLLVLGIRQRLMKKICFAEHLHLFAQSGRGGREHARRICASGSSRKGNHREDSTSTLERAGEGADRDRAHAGRKRATTAPIEERRRKASFAAMIASAQCNIGLYNTNGRASTFSEGHRVRARTEFVDCLCLELERWCVR